MKKVTIREDDCIRNIHFLKVFQSDLELSSCFFAAEMYIYNGFNIGPHHVQKTWGSVHIAEILEELAWIIMDPLGDPLAHDRMACAAIS